VAGLTGMGWYFLGWSFVSLGSAGLTTRLLPRGLSGLYLVAGAAALFAYLPPDLEGFVVFLGVAEYLAGPPAVEGRAGRKVCT
jgi:hypothetical protein